MPRRPFNDPPAAYLITFRCYGTWLHGDERGSADPDHRGFGEPLHPKEDGLREWERAQMTQPPASLDVARREVVGRTVVEVADYKGWDLHAVHVRTNHVHVVVSADRKPELVMNAFKGYATGALRKRGLAAADEKLWSRHGSTHYLWDEGDVWQACQYVWYRQGEPLPGSIPPGLEAPPREADDPE
ncbi:MAG: transposase [Tepidiformaceae bacterium]